MQEDKDIFITQRGGKIQLEPIKAYVKSSYEFPMQPVLLDNNIASVQDTFLFDVQEQHKEYQKKIVIVQSKYSEWLKSKAKLMSVFQVEKEKHVEHKERFSKFIEENRVKMKRSHKRAEDDIKARLLTEARNSEIDKEINLQKNEFSKLTNECQAKKELEYILEETLKQDPQSACFTVSSWISHFESLKFQKRMLTDTIREIDIQLMNKSKKSELKAFNDSSINMNYIDNAFEGILETNQINQCISSISDALNCKPIFLHLIIRDYETFLTK